MTAEGRPMPKIDEARAGDAGQNRPFGLRASTPERDGVRHI
jgi:hypothetical protein